jgi:hypothetical protein
VHGALDSSSQHKKITPILNNAPFEQTFRVTVYLPKNQLYVSFKRINKINGIFIHSFAE